MLLHRSPPSPSRHRTWAVGRVQVAAGDPLAPIGGLAASGGSGPPAAVPAPGHRGRDRRGRQTSPACSELPVGARIGDLVDAAGGFGPRLDADRASLELNLAARLADGDRVVVPSRDDRGLVDEWHGDRQRRRRLGFGAGSTALVDLNRATSAELEALPGIGPVTAGKIITSREEQPFAAVEDLRTRKLVGAKTFDELKDLVSVR